MKVSVNWLKEYVNVGIPTEKLAHRLTMAGLEVEHVQTVRDDAVLEIEVTPNRPDCLNVLGIAREISAALNRPLKLPRVKKIRFPSVKCDVAVLDREACSRYVGTVIKNVNVSSSPDWLARHLGAIGLRSINNVVDITNFCLMETGQPLHVFDYDKLIGGKIIVRRARAGESIVAIDGVEHKLDPSILVIADAQRPVAIAGVMGGKDTEVTANTKNILLESAYFNPVIIRRGARKLGLSSDSSYRFERGVDLWGVESGANRAIGLIRDMAGGEVFGRTDLFIRQRKIVIRQIIVSKSRIDGVLGTSIPLARCKTILKQLGFSVKMDKNVLKVVPPSSRNDVRIPEDVVEEVARMIGYDQLPVSLPLIKMINIPMSYPYLLKKRLREVSIGLGFSEVITYTMINRKSLEKAAVGVKAEAVIKNPLSQDQGILRPTLLPSLLAVARLNFNHGQKNLKIFEIGRRYLAAGERDTLAFLMTGVRREGWRGADKEPVDFYDAKGVAESLFGHLFEGDLNTEPTLMSAHVGGESASLQFKGLPMGSLGRIKKDILRAWDIKQDNVYFGEIYLENVLNLGPIRRQYAAVPDYPSVIRDVSVAVRADTFFDQIRELAFKNGGEYLSKVNFLEEYLGDKIEVGQRGLVFSLIFQSSSRTLTEPEVNGAHQRICEALVGRLGAKIR